MPSRARPSSVRSLTRLYFTVNVVLLVLLVLSLPFAGQDRSTRTVLVLSFLVVLLNLSICVASFYSERRTNG